MKCSIMLHFIWVFTVCKSTRLVVSRIQRVNDYIHATYFIGPNEMPRSLAILTEPILTMLLGKIHVYVFVFLCFFSVQKG